MATNAKDLKMDNAALKNDVEKSVNELKSDNAHNAKKLELDMVELKAESHQGM